MGSYGTARPAAVNDTMHTIDGSPLFLGVIVSTGTALNNATTATPFNSTAASQGGLQGGNALQGTLAGKCLMLQSSVIGFVLPSTANTTNLIAQATSFSPGQAMGPEIQANERVLILMLPTEGWIQYLPLTGSGNLFVWELR